MVAVNNLKNVFWVVSATKKSLKSLKDHGRKERRNFKILWCHSLVDQLVIIGVIKLSKMIIFLKKIVVCHSFF